MGTRKNCPKTPRQMRELWQQLADELNSCRGPIRSAAKWKEDALTSLLSRSARNKLTSTLIADIYKRNPAEEERRRQHREIVQAIQDLTNSITELIKSNSNNVK